MRDVKFRGKAIMTIEDLDANYIQHQDGWVTGNLVKNGTRPMIVDDILEEIEESIYPGWWAVVHPESVIQFTGLKDKNGKGIYENDFLEDEMRGFVGVVVFSEGKFVVEFENIHEDLAEWSSESVIGNTYKNPELLGRD